MRLLICSLLLTFSHTLMASSLSPQIFSGSLGAKNTARHPITSVAGELIHGSLQAPTMRLVLLNQAGEVVRRLATGNGLNSQDFSFIAAPATEYSLEVRAPEAASYQLKIERSSPLPKPPTSASPLQSPTLQALGHDNTEAFWQKMQQEGTPLVETIATEPNQALITFLYRGAKESVVLLGAPASGHEALQRLGQTDIWYRSYLVPRNLRLSYRFAPDAPQLAGGQRRLALTSVAQRDPLNPRSFPPRPLDLFNGESTLVLDPSPDLRWLNMASIPLGQSSSHRISSKLLGNSRRVQLYRPQGYQSGAADNGLLVMFDGERQDSARLVAGILDQLQAAGKIPPTALLLINNADRDSRSKELPPNPLFARFMAEELMPWARQQGVYAASENTVIYGSSFGGIAASWIALQYPQLFGQVYAQSASCWWHPDWENPQSQEEPGWLMREFAKRPRAPLRFHLEAGIYEAGGARPILESVRHFRDVLVAKGYPVSHQEFASGHDAFNWFASLGQGLITLLGKDAPKP